MASEHSPEDSQGCLGSGLLLDALREAQHAQNQAREALTPVQGRIDVLAPRAVEPTPRWDIRRAALVARTAVSSIHLGRGHDGDPRKRVRHADGALCGLRLRPVEDVTVVSPTCTTFTRATTRSWRSKPTSSFATRVASCFFHDARVVAISPGEFGSGYELRIEGP